MKRRSIVKQLCFVTGGGLSIGEFYNNQHLSLHDTPKFTQIGILGFKIYHLAILIQGALPLSGTAWPIHFTFRYNDIFHHIGHFFSFSFQQQKGQHEMCQRTTKKENFFIF
jgi:hypothetical protein